VHCGGSRYVFTYSVEKALKEQGINIYDIPPIAFNQIPHELVRYCHCTVGMLYFRQQKGKPCEDCDGTTWLFSEEARISGYGWRKISSLTPRELKELPCSWFERCACEQETNRLKYGGRNTISKVFSLLNKGLRFNLTL